MGLQQVTKRIINVSPLKFFICTSAVFGLIFLLITPPFQAPDEPVHFFRSYQVSTLNLRVDKIGSGGGGYLPQSLENIVLQTAYSPQIQFIPNRKYDINNTKKALKIRNDYSKKARYEFSTTAYYSPVSYIPQSIGIAIARLLKLPTLVWFYVARLFNLAAWVCLFALAIKIIPDKKWIVAALGLVPMALFQAASLSSDVMAEGLLVLMIALIIKNIKTNKFNKNTRLNLAAIFIAAISLALSKQIMFIFLPLALLLPPTLFKNKKSEYLYKLAAVFVPLLLFGIWMIAAGKIDFNTSVNGINPQLQTQYVMHHPLSFINSVFNTYFYTWGDGIIRSFVGNFGWVDAPLSELIVVIGYIVLFLIYVGRLEKSKINLSPKGKVLITTICLAFIAATTAALYVYFTPVGFKVVIGLVGRYYIPVALAMIPVIEPDWIQIKPKAYKMISILGPTFLLVVSCFTVYVRYYINNV